LQYYITLKFIEYHIATLQNWGLVLRPFNIGFKIYNIRVYNIKILVYNINPRIYNINQYDNCCCNVYNPLGL